MRKTILLLICCLCFGVVYSGDFSEPESMDELLEKFDAAYKHRDRSLQQRITMIDSLKGGLAGMPARRRMLQCDVIGESYRRMWADSAARWFGRGLDLATELSDTCHRQYYKFKRVGIWPEMGLLKKSETRFEKYVKDGVMADNVPVMCEEGSRMYSYIAWCTDDVDMRAVYQTRSNNLADSLLAMLPDTTSVKYMMHKALFAYHAGHGDELLNHVDALMRVCDSDDVSYSDAAALAGIYFKKHKDMYNAKYYLCKGAIADMDNGRLVSTAIEELVSVFYEDGDLERASLCAVTAMRNASASGSSRRVMQIIDDIPDVMVASVEKRSRIIVALYWLVGGLLLALLLIGVLAVKFRTKIRNLHRVKNQLIQANYMKEAYMNRFMGLCSMYMQKTGDFMKLATRKIKAGQQDELFAHIMSGKLLDEQMQLFCDNFDEVFIKVYPTFVDDVNNLLLPDKRITLPEGKLLTTELRILACTRLGIADGASIARFLDLSLNTIYTYRNKLKNRARNRDTFEHDVMEIGRIE